MIPPGPEATALDRRAPRFTVAAIDLFERDVRLRLPFRFGAATVRHAPQAFVRATIRAASDASRRAGPPK